MSTNGFPSAGNDDFYQPKDSLAVLVDTVEGPRRLFISADDHATIRGPELDWADRLGKVNLPLESGPERGDERVIALGPSFGVRSWDLRESLSMAWKTRRAMPAELAHQHRSRLFFDQYRNRLPEHDLPTCHLGPGFRVLRGVAVDQAPRGESTPGRLHPGLSAAARSPFRRRLRSPTARQSDRAGRTLCTEALSAPGVCGLAGPVNRGLQQPSCTRVPRLEAGRVPGPRQGHRDPADRASSPRPPRARCPRPCR